jgi:GNAT superfamily N-acetyltransferase
MPRAEPPLIVRPAKDGDRPAIARLNAELQAVERGLRPSRCAPEALPDAVLAEMLARGEGGVLVAVEGGAVVAFLAYRFGEDLLESEPRFCAVTDLVVVEAARGRGVGGRLLAAVEALALAGGAVRLRVTSLAENRGAIAAYAARGFSPAFATYEKMLPARGGRPPDDRDR